MRLFGKKEKKKSCCCEGNCTPEAMKKAEERNAVDRELENRGLEDRKSEDKESAQNVKILGSGCAKCQSLERAVRTAVEELGLDFEIEHVTDFAQIARYGVMSTPALVLNGKVVSYGKVLSVEEVKALLSQA